MAGTFGAGSELDVYYTAFTVPDFIALILIFGAISAAVINEWWYLPFCGVYDFRSQVDFN